MNPLSPDDLPHDGRFNRVLSRLLEMLRVDDIPHIKRIIVTIIGGTVLLLSVALLVMPVPGSVLVVPVGLAILGTEYAWARRWLRRAREMPAKTRVRTHRAKRRMVINYVKFMRRRAAAKLGHLPPPEPDTDPEEFCQTDDPPAAAPCSPSHIQRSGR